MSRIGDVYTSQFDVATWDLECDSVWEKILYIEYCTWAGFSKATKGGIELSINTISRKLAKTMNDFAEATIYNNLKIARKSLELKGIIKEVMSKGYRGTKKVWLNDCQNSRNQKRWKHIYAKRRFYELYKVNLLEKDLDELE